MSRRQQLDRLRAGVPGVLPSLLLCDFGNLEQEVRRLDAAGVTALHLDVMDGHFVPNLTYGMPIVAALRKLSDLPLDVHLMISQPRRYLRQFSEAGADLITIHIEAVEDPLEELTCIKELGASTGLALNPDTPLSRIEPYLDLCDLVLIMSVKPGFGGQQFNAVALDKLSHLRERTGRDFLIEVDGGINTTTIGQCAAAGAELFVVGSAIFSQSDYGTAVNQLKDLARSNRSRSHS